MNSYSSLPFQIIKRTDNSLYSVRFSTEDILKINDLYFSKDCGHEETRMLRICGSSICTTLQIIYESCLDRRKFPQGWKKTKVVPVHRKNDKFSPCYLYVVKPLNVHSTILCLISQTRMM